MNATQIVGFVFILLVAFFAALIISNEDSKDARRIFCQEYGMDWSLSSRYDSCGIIINNSIYECRFTILSQKINGQYIFWKDGCPYAKEVLP